MKKIILIIFLLFPLKVFSISAKGAIGMDLDTGRVLYSHNINQKLLIASTTKIMTAIVAIENTDINREIIVDESIKESYGSAIYIKPGEKILLKDLLYGLMLRSGNDAAIAISIAVSGSTEAFVYLMNEYANNLSLNNTTFYNPHGLDEENNSNTSTAYDMALLTKYAMQNSTFREIFKTKKYSAKTDLNNYLWINKNKLLKEDYITGGKTGYTEKSKRTLVSTGSKNNINIVVVTLNDKDDWNDHKYIYNKIFKEYKSIKVLNKSNKINNNYYKKDRLYIKNDYYIALNNKDYKKVNINYNLIKYKEYYNGDIVGYAEVKIENTIYHKEPIYIKIINKDKINIKDKIKRWLLND